MWYIFFSERFEERFIQKSRNGLGWLIELYSAVKAIKNQITFADKMTSLLQKGCFYPVNQGSAKSLTPCHFWKKSRFVFIHLEIHGQIGDKNLH